MANLLVNSPGGEQRIIPIDDSGWYFDPVRVLWDTRKQGEMPEVTLGKMQLAGNKLITLADYLPEHAAYITKQDQRLQAENKKAEISDAVEKDKDFEALRPMADAEIDAWFAANVTTKGSTEAMLKKIVKALIKQEIL